MSTMRLTGNDTIKINERLLNDFGHGEVAKITFATDRVTVKTGKNGNTIYSSNAAGLMATMELKVLRASSDDKFMNGLLTTYNADPASFTLINGELVKRLGDGAGLTSSDTSILTGGVISKQPEVVVNVEGDVEQAITVYTLQFGYAARTIS